MHNSLFSVEISIAAQEIARNMRLLAVQRNIFSAFFMMRCDYTLFRHICADKPGDIWHERVHIKTIVRGVFEKL